MIHHARVRFAARPGPRLPGASSRRLPSPRTGARRFPLLAACVLAAACLLPAPLAAQDEPAMAEAPSQFRLGASGSRLLWDGSKSRTPEDGWITGLTIERVLSRFLAVRLSGAVGSSTTSGPSESTDLFAYLLDFQVVGRLAVGPLRRAGVVPYLSGGAGSLVHDPSAGGLPTVSQTAVSYGAGLDLRFLPRWGLRLEWRRYSVEMEDLFDPLDRQGATRHAHRLEGALLWSF